MSILPGASKLVINDGQFNAYDNRVTNSISQPVATFGTITPESASSPSSSMFWLHGPVGVGKSAVAQAVALLLEQEEDLAASYFFSRIAPGRNNGNMLIVTLAYQIATNFPPTRTYIAKNINRKVRNPSIFTLSNQVQIQKLIVEPVNRVRKSFTYRFSNLLFFLPRNQPRLIVVDGLDECDDPEVECNLLSVIGQASYTSDSSSRVAPNLPFYPPSNSIHFSRLGTGSTLLKRI
ncbi:hypothetical protein BDZ97DRAFT_1796370, partial [Flammula alnicola]